MEQFDVAPSSIDTILISHPHGEHFGWVPFFLLEAMFGARDGSLHPPRTRPLIFAGPLGTRERVDRAMEVFSYPGLSRVQKAVELEFITPEENQKTAVAPPIVSALGVLHGPTTNPYALRVHCAGKTMAYSGDTGWTDTLLRVAGDAIHLRGVHLRDGAWPSSQ